MWKNHQSATSRLSDSRPVEESTPPPPEVSLPRPRGSLTSTPPPPEVSLPRPRGSLTSTPPPPEVSLPRPRGSLTSNDVELNHAKNFNHNQKLHPRYPLS